jgi:hypothetical protein
MVGAVLYLSISIRDMTWEAAMQEVIPNLHLVASL